MLSETLRNRITERRTAVELLKSEISHIEDAMAAQTDKVVRDALKKSKTTKETELAKYTDEVFDKMEKELAVAVAKEAKEKEEEEQKANITKAVLVQVADALLNEGYKPEQIKVGEKRMTINPVRGQDHYIDITCESYYKDSGSYRWSSKKYEGERVGVSFSYHWGNNEKNRYYHVKDCTVNLKKIVEIVNAKRDLLNSRIANKDKTVMDHTQLVLRVKAWLPEGFTAEGKVETKYAGKTYQTRRSYEERHVEIKHGETVVAKIKPPTSNRTDEFVVSLLVQVKSDKAKKLFEALLG